MKKIFIPLLVVTGIFTGCKQVRDQNEIFDNVGLEEETGVPPPIDIAPTPVLIPAVSSLTPPGP